MTNKPINEPRFSKLKELEDEALREMRKHLTSKDKKQYEELHEFLVDWLKTTQSLQINGFNSLCRVHHALGHSEPIVKWLKKTQEFQDKNFDYLIKIHGHLDNDDLTIDGLRMQENSERLAWHCENLLDEVFVIAPQP